MEICRKPSRSDIGISREEEAETEDKTREYFIGLTPQRHTKPERSEYSSQYVDNNDNNKMNNPIPEFAAFQCLEQDPQKMVYHGSEVEEEFVETEYYEDFNSIDKQHHTTGSGFIKMESGGKGFKLGADGVTSHHASCKCNPATNDWVPAADYMETFASGKPSRSDN